MVAEDNFGGEMVESVIRGIDATVNVKRRTATRSKTKRAEPILAFFERGEAHIVGEQQALEDQLVQFTPSGYVGDASPDDADAMVWAATELMLGSTSSWDDMVAANG
jgi:phage terminase large subunit-like protein